MQVIIISSNSKSHKHWHLTKTKLLMLSLFLVSLISVSTYTFANWLQNTETTSTPPLATTVAPSSEPETEHVYTTKLFDDETVQDFYARQLGGLQAETIRLKMLSQRLAEIAGFDASEFFLEQQPAQGGLEHEGTSLSSDEIDQGIEQLSLDLKNQQQTLSALEQFLLTKETITNAIPDGRPIKGGWISSFYGYRVDPFNGKKTFHEGLDFAGKLGTKVTAVADGIVSWVGDRGGYGGLVEIDHGNGYVTRYAHNKTILVKLGERVSKGQKLALMGSTGRSTGPHVHFEVLRDGKHVNPYDFVK